MTVSVIVATYGDPKWHELAKERAIPSIMQPGVTEFFYYHFNDGGIAAARNVNAKAATGEWLLFVDADDEIAPGYIGAMTAAVEREANATRLLFTPAVQVIRSGRTPGPPTFFRQVPLRDANWLVVGTLIHRDLFWEVGGFPDYPHGLEDWALWSKCARVGATVVKVPGAVYRYHANPDSEHRKLWRQKGRQRDIHRRVAAELDEWEATWVST